MIPVTIVILALHIILAFRLVFFNRYPQKVVNTATEPTLLQLVLSGFGIVILSLGSWGGSWKSIIMAIVAWAIAKFNKRKKVSSE